MDLIGRTPGNYRIVTEIGRGDMGVDRLHKPWSGPRRIRAAHAGGAGRLGRDHAHRQLCRQPAWAPDSQWIVFTRGVDTNGSGGLDERDESDLWAIRLSDRLLTPLVEAPGNDFSPAWTY